LGQLWPSNMVFIMSFSHEKMPCHTQGAHTIRIQGCVYAIHPKSRL